MCAFLPACQVGHGETVTVRVPTHEEGTALFWEFSTDSYDVAFGLFFEWNKVGRAAIMRIDYSNNLTSLVKHFNTNLTSSIKNQFDLF